MKNVFGKQTRRDDSKKLNLLKKFAKWVKDVEKRQILGGGVMTLKIIQKYCSFFLPDLRVGLKLYALSPSFVVLVR